MKTITLFNGKIVFIDDVDFDLVKNYKWRYSAGTNTGYAIRHLTKKELDNRHISMHRLIIDAPLGFQVDHIDGNGLNNQRNNLRLVSIQQNQFNRIKSKNTSSKFKGVCWNKQKEKWMVRIRMNYVYKYLGHFINEIDAAKAYDKAALKYFGEFARLNLPELIEEYKKDMSTEL